MNTENTGELDTLIQTKLEEDTEFQESLVDLEEQEKEDAIKAKSYEIVKEEFGKASELAKNYKIRAEKAEKAPKEPKKEEGENYSIKDIRALAQIHDDDVDEVTDYAKFKKMTIAEVVSDPTLKAILAGKAEERETANAQNTKTARPSVKKVSGTELNKNLSKGEIPEKGSEEADELFWERRGGKRQ